MQTRIVAHVLHYNSITNRSVWHQVDVILQKVNDYTGWLKLKYPTGQNAISRQPYEIFIPKFLDLYGRDPATILIFFIN